jgi:pimeloyl-ACP methyl ester carboxylesterase
MIHGFGAESYWLNEWFMGIRQIYELGCDVLAVTLPFHGPRQNRFSPFSGCGLFAGGLPGINEAFGHAIFDIRCFMNILEEQFGVTQMGVTGVSLGGYTAALLASVEPRLEFCIPIVPVASIPDLALEWEPLGTIVRRVFQHTNHTLEDMRRALAVTSPLTYQPVIDRHRLFVIGGVGDRLAPPKHTRLLWEHWDECRIHWFPGSHLLHLDKQDYMGEVERFMMEIGFM